ncbi:MAG: HAD-IA family hydrolase, partial [Phycisphaerae bacterium]|nr:HAD-IA family hydrolase [Phycisphaerae bacterium]
GVLVDSGAAHAESWRIVARQHGLDVSDELFQSTFGRPSRDIIRIIWGADTTDARVAELDDEKELRYRELIHGNIPLMPGCREMLAALRDAGLVLSVATSGPRENLECVISEGRLSEFFTATVHGFDIQHGKPAPDCFLLAAKRCGLPPADCVVVEDAPVGIEAATAAGMPAIALTGTHPAERLRAAGASEIINHLSALAPALITKCLKHQ